MKKENCGCGQWIKEYSVDYCALVGFVLIGTGVLMGVHIVILALIMRVSLDMLLMVLPLGVGDALFLAWIIMTDDTLTEQVINKEEFKWKWVRKE